ncbi:ester cyclase [Brachybacterium sp. P6-10-X1]|nr:ester cyclase [Brachybacterium sp. P6-10-X1]
MSDEHYRLDDGMIVEEWIVTDTASLFAQISDHTT